MDYTKEVESRFSLQKEFLGDNKLINKVEPLVSVCVQTYQHESFINDCLNGILMQKTSFPFEIVLGEDDSKDNTRAICIDYAKRHTDKIRLFLRDRAHTQLYDHKGNLVRRLNGIFTRMSARGKYIALCEGDDYWTDPLKLQKQVDLMEKHPEASLSIARCGRKDLRTNVYTPDKVVFQEKSLLLYFDDKKPYFHTSTFLMRKDIYDRTYKKYARLFLGDTSIRMLLNHEGPFAFLNEEVSVYRITGEGVWTSLSKREQDLQHYHIFKSFRKYHVKEKRRFYAKKEIKYSGSVIANNLKAFSFASLPGQLTNYFALIIQYDPLYPFKRLYRKFFRHRTNT